MHTWLNAASLRLFSPFLLAAACFLLVRSSQGAVLTGPQAKALFLGYVTNFGDTFINFETLSYNSALDTQLNAQGVNFASIIQTDGSVIIQPHNIYVSSQFISTQGRTIVGTPAPGSGDDGRVGYEIRFNSPQRRAGIQRIWNTNTLTRFFAQSGTLLSQIQGSMFIGYHSESEDSNNWIKRIEIDGLDVGGSRQVGYSDDLFFGSVSTNPPTLSLTLGVQPTITLNGLTGRTHRIEYLDAISNVNNWQTLTNLTLTGPSGTAQDTNSPTLINRFYRALLLPLP